ncbi:mitochondrial ribosomal subunit protein-domain-containing protein [Podospora conica]|nr:mitochondrial ribosomal subunit protein-domain-containing protein [Schizothecium conicum]
MAATSTPLRHCLRTCSSNRAPLGPLRRALSTTPARLRDDGSLGIPTYAEATATMLKKKDLEPQERTMLERLNKELTADPGMEEFYERKYGGGRDLSKMPYHDGLAPLSRPIKGKSPTASFWNKNEPDPDYVTNEIGEDEWEEDDILSNAHGKLEEHREGRQYARIVVWEMPLLAKYAREFKPPAQDQVLRFRYTTYMGEFHPADKKVVVEFSPSDLKGLSKLQREALKKLAGARYNPERDIVKMSCERFEHQAQNKRYLGDTVQKLIEAAKTNAERFQDIPLDTRHHKFKRKLRFPAEWTLTEERKAELEAQRKQVYKARELPIPAVRQDKPEVKPELIPEHVYAGDEKRL